MSAIPNARYSQDVSRQSESLFRAYLHGLQVECQYEIAEASRRKRPDFRVSFSDRFIYFEVKSLLERPGRLMPPGAAMFNPIAPIRKRIEKARMQFEDHEGDSCVLVLHNHSDWEFRDEPYIVFGAMVGDPGIQFPIAPSRGGRGGPSRLTFGPNGKMTRQGEVHEESRRISAIAVLSEFVVPNPDFEREYRRRIAVIKTKNDQGIADRIEVRMKLYQTMAPTLGTRPRLSIHDNPFARVPFPKGFLNGPYDTRYRWNAKSGCIRRSFIGAGLKRIEKAKDSDLLQKIERFKDAVVKHFRPSRIYLFGSQAYGNPGRDSDVDLLVVFPGNGDESFRSLAIRQSVDCNFAMDLICCSEGRLQKRLRIGDYFLQDIVQRGKILYEARSA